MSERFIKYIPSDEAKFLRKNYPNAFLLLSLIAERARRISGQPDGLIIGDAILGDYECAGLTRQQHRTAIEKLVEFGYIEIIYNGKKFLKREKSTIRITIIGMLVNLKCSKIWDINSEDSNHHINQRATNEQPTSNHKQERTRKNKKEKEITTPKPPNEKKDVVDVVSFDSLLVGLDLSESTKKTLKEFPLDRLKLAVEFVKSPTFVPIKGVDPTLIWHCRQPMPPLSEEQKVSKNQQLEETNKKTISEFLDKNNEAMKEINKQRKVFYYVIGNSLRVGYEDSYDDISLHEEPYVFRQILEGKMRNRNFWISEKMICI